MRHLAFLLVLIGLHLSAIAQVHTSYLWHLHQPIYWAEQSTWSPPGYQKVWESHSLKTSGGNLYSDGLNHPLNDLFDIFSKADRVAAYQFRPKDAVSSLLSYPKAGAQVCYSGALIENINSLGNANQWGYSPTWKNNFITARNWSTSGGKPRMDIVAFTFHHALSPLVSEKTLKKELQANKHIYQATFGTSPAYSKGYWPAECAFSERIIKALVEEGIEWSVIANSHLARTLADYPISFNTSGTRYDPPNKADQVGTSGTNWWSGQLDGRGGAFAAPYCYQAHKARYIDPASGQEYKMTVVPMCDLLSYQNGFATMGTGDIDQHIAPFSNPQQPSLVLMAHDGDNAWGGGYDYYNNSVPGLAGAAAAQGYTPTTIEQFLADHPVPANDVVHVEDGAWFNADNDWGHVQFINWLWPMYNSAKRFDPNGWTEDARNWAVLVAAENRVQMAEDLSGSADIADIVAPGAAASQAELAWHFLLPGMASDYMYYGTSLDMEVKQTLSANLASGHADQVIAAHPNTDNTAPSVFIPQRFPWNPGGLGFGPVYGYQQHQNSSDFHIWTFAYDVAGLQSVVLKYRTDLDDANPMSDNQNETYAGGAGVTAWQSQPMNQRVFPTGNVTGNPDVNFFLTPDYIADLYWVELTGLHDTLIDYYVEATDLRGNVFKTPIQHVYVGASNTGGSANGVHWTPSYPTIHDTITIHVPNPPTGGLLHWGVNGWNQANPVYWPAGSTLFNGTGPAIESSLSQVGNELQIKIGPFDNAVQAVTMVDFVIHYNNNTWDNNSGQDYHIPIQQPVGNSPSVTGEGVRVWPNPVQDKFKVQVPAGVDPGYLCELYDLQGKLVRTYALDPGVTELARGPLGAGVYLLRVTGWQTRQVHTGKIWLQ